MTDDELRAALDAVMSAAACEHCDALLELVVWHDGNGTVIAHPKVTHEDGCDAA